MKILSEKQPGEAYYVAFDFGNAIGNEGIASATVIVTNSAGADVTSTITSVANQTIVGDTVNIWVKGGIAGQVYKISCVIVSQATPAETYELDAELPIVEE